MLMHFLIYNHFLPMEHIQLLQESLLIILIILFIIDLILNFNFHHHYFILMLLLILLILVITPIIQVGLLNLLQVFFQLLVLLYLA